MTIKLIVYVDGSCDWKSRLGGAGVYITDGTQEWYFSKGFKNTTISRMEGMALLIALRSLHKDIEIEAEIYSDSQYITKSFTEHRLTKWQMIGWNQIKNVDMWKAILSEINQRPKLKLSFNHINGHQDNISDAHVFGNAVADRLADFKVHAIYHHDNFN